MSSMEQALNELLQHFRPEAARGLDLCFQFEVSDGVPFQLLVSEEQCRIEPGTHPDPDICLSCDSETLEAIVRGQLDGMQAFLAGDLQAEGDIALALKLGELFELGSDQESLEF